MAQIKALRRAGALPSSREQNLINGALTLTLAPHALALIEISK
jgi:hypothetical protein